MIIAGTGHRPKDCEPEDEVRTKIRAALLEFPGATVITGMAAGFDLFLGLEAIELGHPTWAARPWAGHTSHVLAYLNPLATKGGTYGTVQYAKKVGKPVRNIYGDNLPAHG
jgi:hypothetical protein